MNIKKFSEALTKIDDKYVNEAIQYKGKKKVLNPLKWSVAAACICLVIAGSVFYTKNDDAGISNDTGASGIGHDESSVFMSYAGPVFPLTVLNTAQGVEAERDICFDFSPYGSDNQGIGDYGTSGACSIVRDQYTLINTTDQNMIITAAYPYAADFHTTLHPQITVDGEKAETTLYSGLYSGGYKGTGTGNDATVNLDNILSWEGYKALLEDGSYMETAFAPLPALNEIAAVYEFTDITDGGSDAVNPTLEIAFTIDENKTTILSYGFNGGGYNPDTGETTRNFSIPRVGDWYYGTVRYLIVVGEDIDQYTLQGYLDGGCNPGDELEGASANVRRYEISLSEILKTIVQAHYDACMAADIDSGSKYIADEITFDMYYGEVCRYFARYGTVGMEAMERYQFGMLEDIINETVYHDRILYIVFQVTIPARESVAVCAELVKEGSFDYFCTGRNNEKLNGYDMVTKLGSSLDFRSQSASLSNTDSIEIIRQNFGFDLANHVTSVKLDMEQEHYYLEIRKLAE